MIQLEQIDGQWYEVAGDEIVKAWSNFDDYLKRHPEMGKI